MSNSIKALLEGKEIKLSNLDNFKKEIKKAYKGK